MGLASGGQDGAICLWDVLTGSRVSHVYGHRGDVTSLVCTTSCVISSGLDDLICIWDRSTGIKLYSIQQVSPGRPITEEDLPGWRATSSPLVSQPEAASSCLLTRTWAAGPVWGSSPSLCW